MPSPSPLLLGVSLALPWNTLLGLLRHAEAVVESGSGSGSGEHPAAWTAVACNAASAATLVLVAVVGVGAGVGVDEGESEARWRRLTRAWASTPEALFPVNVVALASVGAALVVDLRGTGFVSVLVAVAAVMGASAAAAQNAAFEGAAVLDGRRAERRVGNADAADETASFVMGYAASATATTALAMAVCGDDTLHAARVSVACALVALVVAWVAFDLVSRSAKLRTKNETPPPEPLSREVSDASATWTHSDDTGGALAPYAAIATVFLIAFGSLTVVPAVLADAAAASTATTYSLCGPLPLLLTLFNAGDLAGRAMAHDHRASLLSPWILLVASVARTGALYPFFVAAYTSSQRSVDTLRAWTVAHGVLHGFLFACSASAAPRVCAASARRETGRRVSFALSGGLMLGSAAGALASHLWR